MAQPMDLSSLFVKFQRLKPWAILPRRATPLSIGLDLFSAEQVTIGPLSYELIDIGLAMEPAVGHYGRIAPKSSLAYLYSLHVGAGVIDPDYRGPIKVLLLNYGMTPFAIKKGDNIAQLIMEMASIPMPVWVPELSPTARGDSGVDRFTQRQSDQGSPWGGNPIAGGSVTPVNLSNPIAGGSVTPVNLSNGRTTLPGAKKSRR